MIYNEFGFDFTSEKLKDFREKKGFIALISSDISADIFFGGRGGGGNRKIWLAIIKGFDFSQI